MNKHTRTTEQSLSMYKETVSPQEDYLKEILSHIPEKQYKKGGRAIRSPYTWFAITQVITLSVVVLLFYPTNMGTVDEFTEIDNQVDSYEMSLNDSDYQDMVIDYTNL